jgi:hypothetical protein
MRGDEDDNDNDSGAIGPWRQRPRGMGGHGMTRDNGAMRGKDAGRWEAMVQGEAMQQPAN